MRISDWSSDVCSSDLQRRHPRQDQQDNEGPARSGYGIHLPRTGGLEETTEDCELGEEPRERRQTREEHGARQKADAEHRHGRGQRNADIDLLVRLGRSEEHTSELQSLMRISYAVFCLNKK